MNEDTLFDRGFQSGTFYGPWEYTKKVHYEPGELQEGSMHAFSPIEVKIVRVGSHGDTLSFTISGSQFAQQQRIRLLNEKISSL